MKVKHIIAITIVGLLALLAACSKPVPADSQYSIMDDKIPERPIAQSMESENWEEETSINFESVSTIYFNFDESTLRPDQEDKLNEQVQWLKNNPFISVNIEGHTDDLGGEEYNIGLGERRAKMVKEYLSTKGIQANKIKVTSYGKSRPVNREESERARAVNRRAVSIVVN
ncbi:peptidoglycan-associated lipoprotein Pal [Candidatus Hepatincolaceae symbiont of Richtersius coronifer]